MSSLKDLNNNSIMPTTPPAAAVVVSSSEMEADRGLNPTTPVTEIAAIENLDVALNPSTSTAAAATVPKSSTPSPSPSPSPSSSRTVNTLGFFPKKARSKRHRSEPPSTLEEYLAECLALLADRNCSGGSFTRNTSNSDTITPDTKPINDEKKSDFLEPPSRSYVCSICNKSFATYQALGGHKSSHNSNKATENNVVSTSAALHNVSSLNPSGKAHVCSICHKSFNSGQALGGHKRLHYGQICINNGVGGNGNLSVTSKEEDMVQSKDLFLDKKPGRDVVIHKFDLNLLPQPEWEEDLKIDSKTTNVSSDEADQDHLPMKKRCLAIKLDLQLALP